MATIKLRKPTKLEKLKIRSAATRGELQTLQELTSSGVDVTGIVTDGTKQTALHLAAMRGHYNVMTFLCSQGAVVNNVDMHQRTPLHWVAEQGHTDCVAMLTKRGANVNMKDVIGNTPLQWAVNKGHHKTVEYFIKQAKVDITQFDMKTQQRINELVKKAEDEQIKGDNQHGSDDIQQDVLLPKSNRDEVLSTSSKSDEVAAQLHHDLSSKVQIHSNTQSPIITTAVHQGVNKRESQQQPNAQNSTDRMTVLEKAFAEMQTSNEFIKNQLSLTQQQLVDVRKTNTNLQNQLSLNHQQLADVQKANTNLQNQLSLTQQQLLGVQSMMTCSRLWVVSHDQFIIGRELGRGAWATVHETKFRGATVAAKCLHQLITAPKTRQLFQREMEMALQCQHQHIVTFLGATLEGPPVILMELMDTNLRSAYEQGNIKDHQVSGILYDIASALHFLHTRPDPVIHRDVSSANVLLKAQYNGEWLAKLGDLGTAKIQQQAATAGPGAIAYGAPEAGDFTKHSPKMDVYSYGVLILEVLTKTHPFQMVDALKVQVQKQFPRYHQMVTSCINQQSSDRPTMYDVMQQLDMIKLTKN